MKRIGILVALLFAATGMGQELLFSGDFGGWQGDFADYPVGHESFYELAWGWEDLPVVVNDLNKGLYLAGNNHSDDLFMFVKYPVDGLEPHAVYTIHFPSVLIESNAPGGSVGIGGAPGESVYFKVGASTQEPQKVDQHGMYRLNVDKGNQARGGANAAVIGNLANRRTDGPGYHVKELNGENQFTIQSDESGRVWLFLGTDSGFEGKTKFYIARIAVQLDRCE